MAKKETNKTVKTSGKETNKTSKTNVKLDEKLDIVEEKIEQKIEETPISLDEAKEAIENVDVNLTNKVEEEQIIEKINEVSKVIQNATDIVNLNQEEKLNEIMSSENPEDEIKKEIEKAEHAKEEIEKIIKRPRTSTWNCISYGF